MSQVRGGYVSKDPATQEALEILALALDYAWDEGTPASSYGIHVILGAQARLISRDRGEPGRVNIGSLTESERKIAGV